MRSFACIDSIEDKIARCELELVPIEESFQCDRDKRRMIELSFESISEKVENVEESDILVVEHENGEIITIYGKDNLEKQRRIEEFEAMMSE